MPLLGHRRWPKNPKYCTGCFRVLRENHGGAEIECSLLFADVRGSTSLAEQMRPKEFTGLMGRFYDAAAAVLVNHEAIVDKFVGDEIIGIFVPAMAGESHARRAVDAAQALLRETGHGGTGEPWIRIGVGVNSGTAYVGSIGQGTADSDGRRREHHGATQLGRRRGRNPGHACGCRKGGDIGRWYRAALAATQRQGRIDGRRGPQWLNERERRAQGESSLLRLLGR